MDLAVLWFWIIAAFFVGYLVLDGFDFGVGISMPLVSRDDTDRRVVINTIGPVWDLNETWVIVAGAAMFAAFPDWYATLFSGFYLPFLAILLALILRGVAFEYRHQRPDDRWKRRIDGMIIGGSILPPFLWGFILANLVQGVPLDAEGSMVGGLAPLVTPYAVLGGVVVTLLCLLHGALFLALKSDGAVRSRSARLARIAAVPTVAAGGVFVAWTAIESGSAVVAILAAVVALGAIAAPLFAARSRDALAFSAGAIAVGAAVLMLFTALAPDVVRSSGDPALSLTIQSAASSATTLESMSIIALIAMPIILLYQGWSYWVFRRRVTRASIEVAAH